MSKHCCSGTNSGSTEITTTTTTTTDSRYFIIINTQQLSPNEMNIMKAPHVEPFRDSCNVLYVWCGKTYNTKYNINN